MDWRKSRLVLVSLIIGMTSAACSSAGKAKEYSPSEEYIQRVKKLSIKDELYSGWTNIFHYSATLITKDIYAEQIEFQSKVYKWTQDEIIKHRRKMLEELGNQSKMFVSFFTPEIRYNDLNEPKSIWRVYLVVNGTRYLGDVKKNSQAYPRLKSIYPKHSPWGKAYDVSFAVPYESLERADSIDLVITGDLGLSEKSIPVHLIKAEIN